MADVNVALAGVPPSPPIPRRGIGGMMARGGTTGGTNKYLLKNKVLLRVYNNILCICVSFGSKKWKTWVLLFVLSVKRIFCGSSTRSSGGCVMIVWKRELKRNWKGG
jgi:hypothetical protein